MNAEGCISYRYLIYLRVALGLVAEKLEFDRGETEENELRFVMGRLEILLGVDLGSS